MLINFVMHTSLFFFNKKSLSIFNDFKENLANLNLSVISETIPKHGLKKRLLFIYAIYFLAATSLISVDLNGAINGLISSITSKTMNSKSLFGISFPVISVFYKITNIMTYFLSLWLTSCQLSSITTLRKLSKSYVSNYYVSLVKHGIEMGRRILQRVMALK